MAAGTAAQEIGHGSQQSHTLQPAGMVGGGGGWPLPLSELLPGLVVVLVPGSVVLVLVVEGSLVVVLVVVLVLSMAPVVGASPLLELAEAEVVGEEVVGAPVVPGSVPVLPVLVLVEPVLVLVEPALALEPASVSPQARARVKQASRVRVDKPDMHRRYRGARSDGARPPIW